MSEAQEPIYTEACFNEADFSGEPSVIRNVLLCGNKSRNGYVIPASAFGGDHGAARLYERCPVFLDHAEHGKELTRSVKEMAGIVRNVRLRDGRPYGDIDTEGYLSGPQLLALAKTKPPQVGMSHTAVYRWNKAGTSVERIEQVVSVDVVFRPATTNTFHERTDEDAMNKEQAEQLERIKVAYALVLQERDKLKARIAELEQSQGPETVAGFKIDRPLLVQNGLPPRIS